MPHLLWYSRKAVALVLSFALSVFEWRTIWCPMICLVSPDVERPATPLHGCSLSAIKIGGLSAVTTPWPA